jgi:hypothetical protein
MPIRSGLRYAMPMWFTDPAQLHLKWGESGHNIENWLGSIEHRCHLMGPVLPMPSGFKKYEGDCDGLMEAIKRLMYDDYPGKEQSDVVVGDDEPEGDGYYPRGEEVDQRGEKYDPEERDVDYPSPDVGCQPGNPTCALLE